MLEHRREMYEEVENKFLIQGRKYSVYVKNEQEINELIMYLKYDFVNHETQKGPSISRIQDTEFVVSCQYKLSLIACYPSDYMNGLIPSGDNMFRELKEGALPLFVFTDKQNTMKYPEYFI